MPISIARWQSPFTGADIGLFVSPECLDAAAGEVLLVQVTNCDDTREAGADAVSLTGTVQSLRRRFPGSPVAVWIPDAAPEHTINLVRAAAGSHVRAILGGAVPDPERWRAELTEPQGLSAFVLRWASDAGYLPEGTVE